MSAEKKIISRFKEFAERLERGEEIEATRVERYDTPDGPMHIRKKIILKKRKEMKEVFILLADGDGTMRSVDRPIGVAVTTEEEAKRYVEEGGVGYSHSYEKVIIFDNKDEALDHLYPRRKK